MKKFLAAIGILFLLKYVYHFRRIKKIQSEPGIPPGLGILSHVRRQRARDYATLQRGVS